MPIFIVKGRDSTAKPRLVKAERLSQVEAHLLTEFQISKADAEQAAELAGDGIKVEAVATPA